MNTPGNQLRWVQPHWKHRKYELRDGEQTIARLDYRGAWKPTAYIVLDQEELVLRSHGVFRTHVVVLRAEQEIARFEQSGSSKNEITFLTGRRFRWSRKGFWASTYSFAAADNEVMMTFKSVHRFFRSEASVNVSPSSYKYPETRILLAFGWYLMLASAQAAATAAAAG